MSDEERSPRVLAVAWGRMEVDGIGASKDFKLYPGSGREWDWNEARTRHSPGIQPADVEELSRADMESVHRDGSRSQAARERPSDKMTDNRHGQRWTLADTHGRSVLGKRCCGAGRPPLDLASGRRGRRFKSGRV
jgi:hypothetical protein